MGLDWIKDMYFYGAAGVGIVTALKMVYVTRGETSSIPADLFFLATTSFVWPVLVGVSLGTQTYNMVTGKRYTWHLETDLTLTKD